MKVKKNKTVRGDIKVSKKTITILVVIAVVVVLGVIGVGIHHAMTGAM